MFIKEFHYYIKTKNMFESRHVKLVVACSHARINITVKGITMYYIGSDVKDKPLFVLVLLSKMKQACLK